jgi:hypothetical protein
MIPIKELRVGNIIFANTGGEVMVVESEYFEMIEDDFGGYEAIPLNEKILLNAGFKIEIEPSFEMMPKYVSKAFTLLGGITEDKNIFLVWKNDDVLTNVKNLHQLQNLYFALTSEELSFEKEIEP